MMLLPNYIILWKLLILISSCHAANILGIATYDGNSHWLVMQSVFKALAEAGHHVTVITPYPKSKVSGNFSLVDVSKALPLRTNSFTFQHLEREYHHPYTTLYVLPYLSIGQCDKAHSLPEVRSLIKDRKFDLVISEIFGADCDAVFAHLLNVPLISVITSTMLPWANERLGNPENPSYVSNVLLPYSGSMSFHERLVNTGYYVFTAALTKYYNTLITEINRKHFGNQIPPIEKIEQRTSLIFVNSHFTVDQPRPFVPNIIEIGGIHLPPLKPLPEDLAKFLNNSKKGAIFFSLGSIIRAASLPNETIQAFVDTFAELDLNVLWKFEDESIKVSPNVIVRKWFPQRDILAHPNLKVAILHGGLMGTYEVVDVGVPIIGMPIFFDQQRNVMNLVSKGAALRVDIDKVTKDYFLNSIKQILTDDSFKTQALQLSKQFHDRLIPPSQAVVYWTDYVLRHEGAYHLRTAAADMPLYQYLLLDVIAFSLGIIYLAWFILKKIVHLLIQLTISPPTTKQVKKRGQNGVHLKSN